MEQMQIQQDYVSLDSSNDQNILNKTSYLTIALTQAIGSFIFTYGVVACDNSTGGIMLIFSISLFLAGNVPFNAAITMVQYLRGQISGKELIVAIVSQFIGSFLGAMVAYFTIQDYLDKAPYSRARLFDGLIGSMYGELFGSSLFFTIVLIQEDQMMKFTDDKIEENIIITIAFQAFRQLAYTSGSLFNPMVVFGLELFESISDGGWGRLGFIWVFTIGPFIGAFSALILVPIVYRHFYEVKLKYNL